MSIELGVAVACVVLLLILVGIVEDYSKRKAALTKQKAVQEFLARLHRKENGNDRES
ncbi:hypothetical protein SEA_SIXAMA_21 [Gordonia phage Sixama]|uniref:Uncharacterized protein n=1 Tax=Gordonia phage Sixama TaxID=2653271 RepID=A0A5Q2F0B9_9CAUD|nr:hypothetical protein PP302_gp021 [Gordonia phage Sixama]QGF20200.1 hypothetical protein SEA_SIXAMA_21 [Gordonia phage Sixama]